MEPTTKVYVVKTAFEHDGLSYAEGEKYELTDSVVAGLPEGSVEEFISEPTPTPAPTPEGAGLAAPPAEEVAKATEPAKPWVGGHTVGRE